MSADLHGFRGLHGRLHKQAKAARAREPRPHINRKELAATPGTPLARARIAAHAAFDPAWKSGMCSRSAAYEWLAGELGITKDQCHMILFDVAMCQRVVAICEAHPHAQRAKIILAARDFDDLTAGK